LETLPEKPVQNVNRKKFLTQHNHPVPVAAQRYGFFYRLKKANNDADIRLLSHNEDPYTLELFLTATTSKWRCYRDDTGEAEIHCYECSRRQQRECAIWGLSKAKVFWSYALRIEYNTWFTENPLVRRSRDCLVLMWLRLQRVYKVPPLEIDKESTVFRSLRK
jgi:hypothetical protein